MANNRVSCAGCGKKLASFPSGKEIPQQYQGREVHVPNVGHSYVAGFRPSGEAMLNTMCPEMRDAGSYEEFMGKHGLSKALDQADSSLRKELQGWTVEKHMPSSNPMDEPELSPKHKQRNAQYQQSQRGEGPMALPKPSKDDSRTDLPHNRVHGTGYGEVHSHRGNNDPYGHAHPLASHDIAGTRTSINEYK